MKWKTPVLLNSPIQPRHSSAVRPRWSGQNRQEDTAQSHPRDRNLKIRPERKREGESATFGHRPAHTSTPFWILSILFTQVMPVESSFPVPYSFVSVPDLLADMFPPTGVNAGTGFADGNEHDRLCLSLTKNY